MKNFFLIFLFAVLTTVSGFAKNMIADSLKKGKLIFKINPTLFSQEASLWSEYFITKSLSVELSGGYLWNNFRLEKISKDIGNKMVSYRGSVFRLGINQAKITSDSPFGLSIQFFYKTRAYDPKIFDKKLDEHQSRESSYSKKRGYQIQSGRAEAWGLQLLLTDKIELSKVMVFEMYFGIGIRKVNRKTTVYEEGKYTHVVHDYSDYYSYDYPLVQKGSPQTESVNRFLPSIHCGIKFGCMIDTKKQSK